MTEFKLYKQSPYDPNSWIEMAQVHFMLSYSELQASCAYRALILADQGLAPGDDIFGKRIRFMIAKRTGCSNFISVVGELDNLRLEAYKALLAALKDLGAHWDALMEVKKALTIYHENEVLLDMQKLLRQESKAKMETLKRAEIDGNTMEAWKKCGRVHKRRHPWLKEDLFQREPALLKEFNAPSSGWRNCEVRPVRFSNAPDRLDDPNDLGSLGVFATQDIKEGEIVLIDRCHTVVSKIAPSPTSQHCDACCASLSPLLRTEPPVLAKCCKKVAFCSAECHDSALKGYHSVLCGKPVQFLYDLVTQSAGDGDPAWRPVILLRVLATIIADQRRAIAAAKGKGGKEVEKARIHPLKHTLLARLTEGFQMGLEAEESEHMWSFQSNVVAPTKTLLTLGADIFADPHWAPEVLHTIFWREVNNACRVAGLTVSSPHSPPPSPPHTPPPTPPHLSLSKSSSPSPSASSPKSPPVTAAAAPKDPKEKEEDGTLAPLHLSGISPSYIFLNHSCSPNLQWCAAGGGLGISILHSQGIPGIRIGQNSMLCYTARKVKKGEELRIAYLPDSARDNRGLRRWFEGGCGCERCEGERAEEERLKMESADGLKGLEEMGGLGAVVEGV
jgi:hypothetical protein